MSQYFLPYSEDKEQIAKVIPTKFLGEEKETIFDYVWLYLRAKVSEDPVQLGSTRDDYRFLLQLLSKAKKKRLRTEEK